MGPEDYYTTKRQKPKYLSIDPVADGLRRRYIEVSKVRYIHWEDIDELVRQHWRAVAMEAFYLVGRDWLVEPGSIIPIDKPPFQSIDLKILTDRLIQAWQDDPTWTLARSSSASRWLRMTRFIIHHLLPGVLIVNDPENPPVPTDKGVEDLKAKFPNITRARESLKGISLEFEKPLSLINTTALKAQIDNLIKLLED